MFICNIIIVRHRYHRSRLIFLNIRKKYLGQPLDLYFHKNRSHGLQKNATKKDVILTKPGEIMA
jgi:hypothetical protein